MDRAICQLSDTDIYFDFFFFVMHALVIASNVIGDKCHQILCAFLYTMSNESTMYLMHAFRKFYFQKRITFFCNILNNYCLWIYMGMALMGVYP